MGIENILNLEKKGIFFCPRVYQTKNSNMNNKKRCRNIHMF
jgi:hypothetical protein